MIGRGDDDGVDGFFGLEHFAPVGVLLGIRIFLEGLRRVRKVAVAEGDDVARCPLETAKVFKPAPTRADDGDVDLLIGGYFGKGILSAEDRSRGEGGGSGKKRAAGELAVARGH